MNPAILALKNFRTFHLALAFYEECQKLQLAPHLKDQLTRATESILLNLGEGSAKPSAKDRARFYSMALGSFRECQIILSLAREPSLLTQFDGLGGCLYKLSRPLPAPAPVP